MSKLSKPIFVEFVEEILNLMKAMDKEYDSSEKDFFQLCRMGDMMVHYSDKIVTLTKINFLMASMETEKDCFEVQRFAKDYEDNLHEMRESLIVNGRTWKYEDYRCIDLMKRLTEWLVLCKKK